MVLRLPKKQNPLISQGVFTLYGGEGGIRTPDTLLRYAPLAGECLRPLGHLSNMGAYRTYFLSI